MIDRCMKTTCIIDHNFYQRNNFDIEGSLKSTFTTEEKNRKK